MFRFLSTTTEEESQEGVEVLDIRGTASNAMTSLQRACRDLSKQPAAKQAAVGGASGWLVGYLSMKLGKAVATVVGGSLLLLQVAHYQGYVQVDWSKVNKDVKKNASKLQKEVQARVSGTTGQSITEFAAGNVALSSSFAGGFFLGIASS